MADLSILIPARREEWLGQTVQDVIQHTSDRTEVIVVLDGEWPTTPLPQHDRLRVVYLPQSIGQRAATNLAARISAARYICKLDAHCSVADGFDVALLEAAQTLGRECVQIPAQRNLHVYDQCCDPCNFRVDQAPHLPECPQCHGPLRKELVWKARGRTRTTIWRFDSELHFQYSGIAPREGEYPETMSCLGACWFLDREWFLHDLGGLDESHGSWGQMGTELGCKAWLSGGRMVCNTKTEFAHFFRVGGIGFPYPITGSDQDKARKHSQHLWRTNAWPGQVKPLRWLVEKFAPAGWTKEQIEALPPAIGVKGWVIVERQEERRSKGIVYYTDGRCRKDIEKAVVAQLWKASKGFPSRGLPVAAVICGDALLSDEFYRWGARTLPAIVRVAGERGYLTMFRQILAGLEALDTEYAFLCEHDVLYHPSHFDFVPPRDDTYYYNRHVYKVDAATGRALHYLCDQTSGLCANRELLVEHYRKRVAWVEQHGFSRNNGFEPGTRKLRHGGFDDVEASHWMSEFPNIDIRHDRCLTPSRWRKEDFRNQRYTEGWTETDSVPGWGKTAGRFQEFLQQQIGSSEVAV